MTSLTVSGPLDRAAAEASKRRVATPMFVVALAVTATSVGMVVSAGVDLIVDGGDSGALAGPGAVGTAAGLVVVLRTRIAARVSPREALITVAVAWLAMTVWCAVPFVLADVFHHVDDALFESASGLSGTGSTVLVPIEGTGRGILFWRQLTQWYGGMGIVVLAVAVLPVVGVGGLELIRSEAPGPDADRLTPRIGETARRLWAVYVVFTVLTTVVLFAVGMSPYDAVVHAFTTVSTGGFSPYDSSIGHFDSVAVEVAMIVLMLAGATAFTLHWNAFVEHRPGVYLRSVDVRTYLGLFAAAAGVMTLSLVIDGDTLTSSVRTAGFTAASLVTSTGYGITDLALFAPLAQMAALLLMFSGGMAGSTSGGAKVLRLGVTWRHALRESRRARRPMAVLPLRYGSSVIPEDVVTRTAGFLALYVLTGVVSVLVVTALGAHTEMAVGGVASALGNSGPGLAEASGDFLAFSRPARAYLAGVMVVGRLELLAVLVAIGALMRRLGTPLRVARVRRATR